MKRLVILLDGTWSKADQAFPTNVAKLRDAMWDVPPIANTPPQHVYYSAGVGTKWGTRVLGGLFGTGTRRIIREVYAWVCKEYTPGDSICVVGFSRGAFEARSLVGKILKCGIINTDLVAEGGLRNKLADVWRAYRSRDLFFWSDRVRPFVYPVTETSVAFLGVFDTVGTLGLPSPWLRRLPVSWVHRFHDVRLHRRVRSAYHAVSLDEERNAYRPALWNEDCGRFGGDGACAQEWFAGWHSDIGGGVPSVGRSDVALSAMVAHIRRAGFYVRPCAMPNTEAPTHPQRGFVFRLGGGFSRRALPKGARLHASAKE